MLRTASTSDVTTSPNPPNGPRNDAAPLSEKWLENFYKECGRKVTLAYTTLNQMKNWAMIVAAAAISGVAFGTSAQNYPNERMFVGVAIVYTFIIWFFFRALICYINLERWNLLQRSCLNLMLLHPLNAGTDNAKRLLDDIEIYFFSWISPISRRGNSTRISNSDSPLLFALPVFFFKFGEP